MFHVNVRLRSVRIVAFVALAAVALDPLRAIAQSCDQLFAKYQQNNFNWWWGAFGNCKTGPGGTTDRAEIFECAWNQVPASDGTACLREKLLAAPRTKEAIDVVVAYNTVTCDQLFAKYQQNNFNWWWGAFGNCRTGPGGIVDRTEIFNCAWNQMPAGDRTACLKQRLLAAPRTKEGIDAVVDYNKPPTCDQVFARYQQNNYNWWWGALGNCKTGPGGTVDRTEIFNCAWNQVPAADRTACLREKLFTDAKTKEGIDAVVDFNKPVTCDQLFAKYQQNNYNWWWGAFGNCKSGPGGSIDRTEIFNCAWNQVPAGDRTACLREKLLTDAKTKEGIDAVVDFNRPVTCDQLFAKYQQNNYNWWWGALGNCKTGPGGLIDRTEIFNCAWNQVPANDRTACLKEKLFTDARTKDGIDVVVEYNKPFTCDQLFAKYQQNNFNWWWGAFGNCKASPGGTIDRGEIFNCAFSQVPANDRTACLKERLLAAPRTTEAIDVVVAYNGAVANNRTMATFTTCANPAQGCPEVCELPTDGTVPEQYYTPVMPQTLVDGVFPGRRTFNDPPAHNIGANEGRLRADLRAAARLADPLGCTLPLAAIHYGQGKDELAQAYADLSVTGRKAFAKFRGDDNPPGERYCRALPAQTLSAGCLPPVEARPDDDKLVAGCRKALDRAYAVANYLRTGQALQAHPTKQSDRKALGWIAVSGEDDSPHRPVNVPSSDYPQFDIQVDVEAPLGRNELAIPLTPVVRVPTRYVIAQSKAATRPARPVTGWRLAPDAVPSIPPNSDILIFVHGMDSRAEEANDITKALFDLAKNSPKNLVVIAVDLPSSGYAENFDYDVVSPLIAIGNPKWTPLPVPVPIPPELMGLVIAAFATAGLPPPPPIIPAGMPLPDFGATGKTPLLDFMEDFVVRFVETLDRTVPIKGNIRAVMGGSLGGNISFRLGRRPNASWIQNVIVWSPASIWTSLGEGADILKHIGPRGAWENANNRDPNDPDDLGPKRIGLRAEFFGGWDKAIVPLLIPEAQSETWTSKYWPCKQSSIAAARLDRHETYDPRFLSWRWRLGAEQLLYSHQTIDPTTNLPRFMSNDKRMLLACGTEDYVKFNDICPATMKTAVVMTMTPGKALFLDKTGHSLDNERPKYWAQQILDFLGLR